MIIYSICAVFRLLNNHATKGRRLEASECVWLRERVGRRPMRRYPYGCGLSATLQLFAYVGRAGSFGCTDHTTTSFAHRRLLRYRIQYRVRKIPQWLLAQRKSGRPLFAEQLLTEKPINCREASSSASTAGRKLRAPSPARRPLWVCDLRSR